MESLLCREPFTFGGRLNQPQFFYASQGAEFLGPVLFASSTFLNGGPWRFAGGIIIRPQRIIEIGNLAQTFAPPGRITLGSPGAISLIDDALLRPIGGAFLHHPSGSTLELPSTSDDLGYRIIDAANQFTGTSQ